VPVPLDHVVPPLVLYCQVAPVSKPVTVTVPALLMPSVLLAPVSLLRTTLGALGEALSMVKAAALLLAALVLPALSVWRTCTAPAA